MIALLSYSTNSLGNNLNSSTGEVDSVLISYDDLRTVNSKLVELKYEKEINAKLKEVIKNDSSIITTLETRNDILAHENKRLNKVNKKYKRQRIISFCIGSVGIATTALMFLK